MDQSQEDGYRTRFRGWKWIYDTFERGGIRSIYWPKRSLYYQSASYKDCIQTLTCHHFSWELNIWSMGGPVQEAYVVMRLDLTEIACTPAIGSWTLTTRGTIFKWQPPESWTNFIRPRKWTIDNLVLMKYLSMVENYFYNAVHYKHINSRVLNENNVSAY